MLQNKVLLCSHGSDILPIQIQPILHGAASETMLQLFTFRK